LITFDIDDTIRLHGSSQPSEQPVFPWPAQLFYREPLRSGFIRICGELRSHGYKLGIYTTSARSVGYIRRWMLCYGFKPDLIVNSVIHDSAVSDRFGSARPPSKHPGLFGVGLHIDDSAGVALEGEQFGFRALIVDPDDPEWGNTILNHIHALYPIPSKVQKT
jgi:hypothetical protein